MHNKLHIHPELFEILEDIYGGTFYRKGTCEYFFTDLVIKKEEISENKNTVIYPTIQLLGITENSGKIKFDLKPTLIKDLTQIVSDLEIENLEGTFQITDSNQFYNANGKITDYWNATFWIDKFSICTNINEFSQTETFIFKTGYELLKQKLQNTKARKLNVYTDAF